MNEKKHLPLFGVGSVIVFGQFVITAVTIILVKISDTEFAELSLMKIPLMVIGIAFIVFGIYLDLSAKLKSKLFKNVTENKLITDGVYGIVRNPVYSGALMMCVDVVLIANNLLLFIVPVICWLYMTIFLINTEEKWLRDLYGDEYISYCKSVNRCIPFIRRK